MRVVVLLCLLQAADLHQAPLEEIGHPLRLPFLRTPTLGPGHHGPMAVTLRTGKEGSVRGRAQSQAREGKMGLGMGGSAMAVDGETANSGALV